MSLYINGELVANECYPNNERIMKFPTDDALNLYRDKHLEFFLRYETDLDLTALSIYKKLLDDRFPQTDKTLMVSYFPYSRMDRHIDGYFCSLKYVAQMINDMNFNKVCVFDPHSNTTVALLDRVGIYQPNILVDKVIQQSEPDYIFYPDAGACKRYSELKIGDGIPVFYGNKARDLNTGKITKFELVNAPDLTGKTVLIVDDLCSKGGTFVASAKELKAAGAKSVLLYVSHCEKAIYNGDLLTTDWVDKIYTTNSIIPFSENSKIEIVWEWKP